MIRFQTAPDKSSIVILLKHYQILEICFLYRIFILTLPKLTFCRFKLSEMIQVDLLQITESHNFESSVLFNRCVGPRLSSISSKFSDDNGIH